jgi:hypothetical protein
LVGSQYRLGIAGGECYLDLLFSHLKLRFAEYALRDLHKPMGAAIYRLAHTLPADLQGSLPTIEDLEARLGEIA